MLNTSVNVLAKARSESYSEEDAEVFNRIEARYTRAKKAKLRAKLRTFRNEGLQKNFTELAMETHSSTLLGEFMRAMYMPRPGARWEAHHIISGDHPEAEDSRAVLADERIKIRIDDPANGCWMPKTKADARPTKYPNAIPHSRIHRERYYEWIFNTIITIDDPGLIKAVLNRVRQQLLQGNIKDELLLQQEIDGAEYTKWLKDQRR